MITPRLETERLILRPLKISDAQTVYDNWTTDPEVSRYMRWSTHSSIEETKTWLTTAESSLNSEEAYDWGFEFKETGELIGSCGMYVRNDDNIFEIGYCIMKKYWGKGIASEVSKAMLEFAINELGERKFYATHDKDNLASGKVLEKLGFIYCNDGEDTSFDGMKTFSTREYILTLN
ncbi:MAG: GNAT family N-acetyltransferase [Oscillospiraceae bacterium]|nr:GNAT family N-acetyltransferase [Oscillospiraceae bacterium]